MPRKLSAKAKRKIENELTKMFYHDYQPFRIVENTGFQSFVRALNPSYELPSRHIIANTILPGMYA